MPDTTQGLAVRVAALERGFDRIERRLDEQSKIREDVGILRAEFTGFSKSVLEKLNHIETNQDKRISDLETETDDKTSGVTKVLVGFALTIAASAIGFAITIGVISGGGG